MRELQVGNTVIMGRMRIIGHGVDIVEVARIADMLNRHGEQFVFRCFTEVERAYANSASVRRAERFAVRFACKEAVFKALGTGWRSGIGWTDVGVVHEPMGQPGVVMTGKCQELAQRLGVNAWRISLSHTETYAIASVIACDSD
jgi:holo-[acyl-carrier protein] synthase